MTLEECSNFRSGRMDWKPPAFASSIVVHRRLNYRRKTILETYPPQPTLAWDFPVRQLEGQSCQHLIDVDLFPDDFCFCLSSFVEGVHKPDGFVIEIRGCGIEIDSSPHPHLQAKFNILFRSVGEIHRQIVGKDTPAPPVGLA